MGNHTVDCDFCGNYTRGLSGVAGCKDLAQAEKCNHYKSEMAARAHISQKETNCIEVEFNDDVERPVTEMLQEWKDRLEKAINPKDLDLSCYAPFFSSWLSMARADYDEQVWILAVCSGIDHPVPIRWYSYGNYWTNGLQDMYGSPFKVSPIKFMRMPSMDGEPL